LNLTLLTGVCHVSSTLVIYADPEAADLVKSGRRKIISIPCMVAAVLGTVCPDRDRRCALRLALLPLSKAKLRRGLLRPGIAPPIVARRKRYK
jgi:hypothetical protein